MMTVKGPTSAPYLLHSSAMIPPRTYETYDMRYHHTWDVSARGDGVIQVNEPHQSELQLSHPKPVNLQIERDVVEKLVNSYFSEVAPLLPIITREEFLASSPPPAVLLYSICLVAATRREVPQAVAWSRQPFCSARLHTAATPAWASKTRPGRTAAERPAPTTRLEGSRAARTVSPTQDPGSRRRSACVRACVRACWVLGAGC